MSLSLEAVDLTEVLPTYIRGVFTPGLTPETELGAGKEIPPVRKNSTVRLIPVILGSRPAQVRQPAAVKDQALMPEELHILSAPGLGWALFHPPTLTLMRTDAPTASLLQDWIESRDPPAAVAHRHRLDGHEVDDLFARMAEILARCPPLGVEGGATGRLGKLILNVSQDCNMRCRYCYAQGGTYGHDRSFMSTEIVRQAIDRVFARYPEVSAVMFFGGEPTLNPEAIQAGCERILALYGQGVISRPPRLGMVTNGLTLSRRMLAIIRRYNLAVTVSLDGPAGINDSLRPLRHGQGGFRRIAANIRRVQRLTGGREPSKIEAVYTAVHRTEGLSMADLANYFVQEFGISDAHIYPVVLQPERLSCLRPQMLDSQKLQEMAVGVVESWQTDSPRQVLTVWQSIMPLITRQTLPYLCGGALTELAVSTNGELYPCQVLIKDEFSMGNVADDGVFESERFQAVQELFRAFFKANLHPCRGCWMRGFCRICLGVLYAEGGSLDSIPQHICAMNQEIAKAALLALCRVHADPHAWTKLCKNLGAML